MPDHPHQNHSIYLQQTFMIICMHKINFITHVFLPLLQRQQTCCFRVLWACLVMYIQSDTMNLQRTFVFICRQNFITVFILEILQSYFGYFSAEISITIVIFILDYFQEKLVTTFFRKSKKSYFTAILCSFCPNLGQMEFSWIKGLCLFIQNQKNIISHSLEKC